MSRAVVTEVPPAMVETWLQDFDCLRRESSRFEGVFIPLMVILVAGLFAWLKWG